MLMTAREVSRQPSKGPAQHLRSDSFRLIEKPRGATFRLGTRPPALDSPDKETDAKSHASFSPELSYCVSGLGATEAPGRSHSKQQPPGVHVTLPRKQQGTPCLKTPHMYRETLKFALSRSDISSRTAVFGVGNQKMASKNSRGPALTPQKHTFFRLLFLF